MRTESTLTAAKSILATALIALGAHANATDRQQYDLSLTKVRTVADYQGTTYDNTI